MENMNEVLSEVNGSIEMLGKDYPDFMGSFGNFMGVVEKEGTLSVKTKELISVALSVVKECKWCIAFHVNNALKAGANKQEIMESCFVATMMGGGPALMYTQLVVKAINDFSEAKKEEFP